VAVLVDTVATILLLTKPTAAAVVVAALNPIPALLPAVADRALAGLLGAAVIM
jgi:hypothetical protein